MRHSLTYYNEAKKFAGNQDIPLSKTGIYDALKAGKNFKYENIDVVFTSTLSRSLDTAILFLSQLELEKIPIIISRNQYKNFSRKDLLPIVQFAELNERDYGILQDMDKDQIEKNISPDVLRSWRREYYDGPQKGEKFHRVVSRVAEFYYKILKPTLLTKDVLVVAHQNTARALYYLIYNIDKKNIDDIEFQNSDIWTINFNSEKDTNKIIPKNAIIIAGGKGSRMGEYTLDMPKPLLEINDKPIIEYLTSYLSNNGFNVTVAYSYLYDKWQDFIEKNNNSMDFYYIDHNMSYHDSFLKTYNAINNKSNYFILSSGDMLFNPVIFDNAIEEHVIKGYDVTVVLNEKYGRWKKWKYIFDKNKTIKDILIEDTVQSFERYFVILNREIIDFYSQQICMNKDIIVKNKDFGSGVCFLIKNLIDLKIKVNYLLYEGYLININDVKDLETAKKMLNQHLI